MTMNALTVVELGLLAGLSWPVTRLVLNPHLVRVAPRIHLVLTGAVALTTAALLVLAIFVPGWLHAVAVAGTAVFAAAAWHARSGFGRSRGLPAGSLALTRSIEAIVDRGYYAGQFRRHGPVFKMAQFHRGVVCVLGHERWQDILRAHRDALGPSLQPFNEDVRGGFLRYMSDERHRVYGRLFRAAFGAAVVRAAEPVTRRAAARHLARVAEGAGGEPIRPADCCEPIVLAAFARLFFGIDPERDTDDMRRLEAAHMTLKPGGLRDRLTPVAKAALRDVRSLAERRTTLLSQGDDTGGPVICALTELRRLDAAMPDDTCLDNLIMTLKIGSSNALGLLHWLVKMLGDHPDWLDRVRADADAGPEATGSGLANRIVMETLRLEQSEYLYRTIRDDFDYEGARFPAGWQVRLCVRESHRRSDVFDDPDTFNPDRFLARAYTRTEYSPFGADAHSCNGVDLAFMICRVTLEEIARGYVMRIAQDGWPVRDFRHRSHWRPSDSLRLDLSPRTTATPYHNAARDA